MYTLRPGAPSELATEPNALGVRDAILLNTSSQRFNAWVSSGVLVFVNCVDKVTGEFKVTLGKKLRILL